jgi:hypothetical protein
MILWTTNFTAISMYYYYRGGVALWIGREDGRELNFMSSMQSLESVRRNLKTAKAKILFDSNDP